MLGVNLPQPDEPNFDLMLATIRELIAAPENVDALQRAGVIFLNVQEAMRVMQSFRNVMERLEALESADVPTMEAELSTAQGREDELEQRLATVTKKRDAAAQVKQEILARFEQVMRLRDDVINSGAIQAKRNPGNPAQSRRDAKLNPVFEAFFGADRLNRVKLLDSDHFPRFGRWENESDE